VGCARGATAEPARLLQSDILAGLLSDRRLAGRGHGEQPRGGAAQY